MGVGLGCTICEHRADEKSTLSSVLREGRWNCVSRLLKVQVIVVPMAAVDSRSERVLQLTYILLWRDREKEWASLTEWQTASEIQAERDRE